MGGTHSFELRLWDARIGRWMSPDPYGQFYSPYLGMGNTPHMSVDPDGGWSGGCPPPLVCDETNNSPWGLSPSTSGEPLFFGSYEIYTDTPIQLSPVIAQAGQAVPVYTQPPSPLRIVPKNPVPSVKPFPWGAFLTRLSMLGSMTILHGDKSPSINAQPKSDIHNKNENQYVTLYRGVHAGHPDYKNAIKGSAYPAILGGPLDVDLQQGGGSSLSGTTSWSMSLAVANYHANKPHPKTRISDGIILKKQFKLNEVIPGEEIFPELEYLVPGPVHGAEVFKPTGPGAPYAY